MKRFRFPVRHSKFGTGLITHRDGAGIVRVTFDKATDGVKTRTLKAAYLEPDMLLAKLGGYIKPPKVPTPYEHADDLYNGRTKAPDETVAERVFREYCIAQVAGHSKLARKNWRVIRAIGRKATKNLHDPHELIGEGIEDGRRLTLRTGVKSEAAVEAFHEVMSGKNPARWFGRRAYCLAVDEFRKRTALKRQPRHQLDYFEVNDLAPHLTKSQKQGMWFDHTGTRRRKPRSDKGKRRGPNSKPRSDKGKPRRKVTKVTM